jgi:hypothetical protein
MTLTEMLESNSIPEPNSGCWLWLRGVAGGRNGPSYPVWKWEGRRRQVPKGFDGCHSCDNTFCINPDHLFVGTRIVNMQDARAKGRLVGYGKREFCKQGHPLSGDNVHVDIKSGKRSCRICKRRWGRITDAKRSPRHG